MAELPPFALLLVAAVAFAVVYVIVILLIYPLAEGLRPIPLVGGSLGDAIKGFGDSILKTGQQVLDAQVQNLSSLIDFVSGSIQSVINEIVQVAGFQWNQLVGVGTSLIGLAGSVGQQIGTVLNLVKAAAQSAADAIARVEALAAGILDTVVHVITKQLAEVTSGIHVAVEGLVKSITDPLSAEIIKVRDHAAFMLHHEEGMRLAGDQSLSTAITATEATLGTEIDAVKQALLRRLGTSVGTLQGEIGTLTDVIGEVAAGTTVVGLITTVATELDTLRRECVDPTCSFLGPQLPVLDALSSAAALAVFAAFVGAAVADPGGTAGVVSDGVDGMRGLYGPIFGGLTGLQA